MSVIKPSNLGRVWADTGEKITPPTSKIEQGWVAEIPPHQYFNYVENRQDQFASHINSHGIVFWDENTQYYANQSFVQGQTTGIVYVAKQSNKGVNPDYDDTGVWEVAFAPITSPEFKGTPTAPTPPITDRSTRIATTDYVRSAIEEIDNNPLVRTPTNVSPSAAATGVLQQAVLEGDAYYSLYGVDHSATEVRIATDKEMSNVVRSATLGAVTSWTVSPTLDEETVYHWQIRYQDSEGVWSDWSTVTQFSTGTAVINPPVFISPTENQTGLGPNPIYTIQPMTVSGGSDTHVATDWELRKDSPTGLRRWWSYNNAIDKTSINIQTRLPDVTLEPNTDYYIRARFDGATLGSSEWSTVKFKTAENFYPTEIGEPYGGGYYAGRIWVGSDEYILIVSPKDGGEHEGHFLYIYTSLNTETGRSSLSSMRDWSGATHHSDGLSNTRYITGLNIEPYALTDVIYKLRMTNYQKTLAGRNDWYIPSKDEMNLIYRNFKPNTTSNNTSGNSGLPMYYPYGYNMNIRPTVSKQTASNPPRTSVSVFQEGGSEALTGVYSGIFEKQGYYYWTSTLETGLGVPDIVPYIQSMRDGEQKNAALNIAYMDSTQHKRKVRFVRREKVVR